MGSEEGVLSNSSALGEVVRGSAEYGLLGVVQLLPIPWIVQQLTFLGVGKYMTIYVAVQCMTIVGVVQ